MRKFDLAFVRSPEDARWAARWIGHPNTQVLPHPAGLGMESLDREGEVPGRILFVGAMGRPFNVDAALFFYREVFPMVRRNMPDAQFWVVGAEPPQRLRALATEDPSLKVTGFVEDLTDHYRRASIFVAPVLVGGGIIVKILDAMAAGVPVVTTPYGNEGIEAPLGEACLVADSPEGFAAHVVSLLFDSGLRLAIGANGKDYVTGRFGKERIFAGLEESLVALSARV